jgi:hypothetical protein
VSLPDSPFRCYFTLVDPYTVDYTKQLLAQEGYQRHATDERIDRALEQNLKAAAMLHEQVVFRATALFSHIDGPRHHARDLIDGAKTLVEKGALVPEVRADDELLTKQLSKPERFGLDSQKAKECVPFAEIVDNAPTKHEADASGLSHARSAQLADHIFRQWHFKEKLAEPYLKPSVSIHDLNALFSILFSDEPVDRSTFVGRCRGMYQNPIHATLLIQTIYFAMGALAAEANPIFPEHLAPSETLWNYPELDLSDLSPDARKLSDKYGISERLALPKISEAVNPKNVLNIIGIDPNLLDKLNWNEIMLIRQRPETAQMREKLWTFCYSQRETGAGEAAINAVRTWSSKLAEEMLSERERTKKVADVQTVNSVLGLIPGVGTVMSCVGLAVDVTLRQPSVAKRFTPLLAFTELVKDTATRGTKHKSD